ncbi:DegT/DnrJ/EryC1/StrS family aminotransferase, partial [Flagellimonas sp.]|uniref:DegT/DnrJ/EryC1/StrS family aminotransferase n=1 Tax=Flagellimonas sp. TaxID=2058762 RepID=UPI003AB2615F
PKLAERLRMIRNHAEAVVSDAKVEDITNMIGFNLRLTELSAAIGSAQLEEVSEHVKRRCDLAAGLSEGVSGIPGLIAPTVREGCTHSYYNWMLRFRSEEMGVNRDIFVEALVAEGVPCFKGYVKPLYRLPVFQKRIAIGSEGFPFTLSNIDYSSVSCSVADRLYEKEFIGIECCAWDSSNNLSENIVAAFEKVIKNIDELRAYSR